MVHSQPRILIVDDEVDTCANLTDILSEIGYQVDAANDGPAALHLMENAHFDVALIDLKMPGMDGLELYRRIKEKSASTVALIVTAYATSEQANSVLASGARKILAKPIDIPHLLNMVQEAIDSPLILIVDDDCDLCDNLWEIFHERGYRVHMLHNASEAGQWVREHRFEVVLLDMKLPGGDSHEVLRVIREVDNPQARTIVITGFRQEMENRIQQALAEGASAVVYKPFDVSDLLKTVSVLSNASQRSA